MDVDSGRVVSILIVSAIPKTTSVKLTSAQAQTAAAAYLESHDIPTDGMTVTVTLQDRGEVKDYVVDWKLYANGVLLPDSRSVSLDPSNGVVYSMNDVREPARPSSVATPAASPKLTRDDAIRLATSVAGMSKPKVESAELKVTSVGDPNWPSRLVWSLQLSEVAPQGAVIAAWVYVDAVTGETTIVGRG